MSAFCGRFSLCSAEGPCAGERESGEGGLIIISLFAVCCLIPYIIFNGNCHILSAPVRGEHKAMRRRLCCSLPPATSRQQAACSGHLAASTFHLAGSTFHLPRATSLLAPLRPSARRQVGECLDRRLKRLLGAGRTCAAFHGRSGESEAVGNRGGVREGGGCRQRVQGCRQDALSFVCHVCFSISLIIFLFFILCECVRVCACVRECVCVSVYLSVRVATF